MDEYLLDISKGQQICISEISPYCKCWRCRKEKNEKAKDSSLSEDLSLDECSVGDEPNRA